jgi:hypothetical protein
VLTFNRRSSFIKVEMSLVLLDLLYPLNISFENKYVHIFFGGEEELRNEMIFKRIS